MTESWNPREHFATLARLPDGQIALDEAALWIAAEEYPELDVAGYLGELDALAEAARSRLLTARDDTERVAQLNRFLFVEAGFHGNRDDYYDPRNSYLNEVLERRCGIPISLSLVYLAVTDRLGLAVQGVGFPGHFLLKWRGDPETLVDPFDGKPLSVEDCERRLHSLGERYEDKDRPHGAIAVHRRMLALDPEDPESNAAIARLAARPDPSLAAAATPT